MWKGLPWGDPYRLTDIRLRFLGLLSWDLRVQFDNVGQCSEMRLVKYGHPTSESKFDSLSTKGRSRSVKTERCAMALDDL